ncbi:MAG TPA: hypothetical protein VGL56_13170 [Fimbriimonadaceae bacterium]|jgi:hypothetical protein
MANLTIKSLAASAMVFTLTAISFGQVSGTLSSKGKTVGSATFTIRVSPNGNVVISSDLTFIRTQAGSAIPGKSLTEVSQTYASNGKLLAENIMFIADSKKERASIIYNATSAKVTATVGKESREKILPYPKGLDLRQPDSLWFITIQPKIGAKTSYTALDSQTFQWKAKTNKYVGDEMISYRGKKVAAHKIISTDLIQWLDGRGYPYQVKTSSGMLFQRS